MTKTWLWSSAERQWRSTNGLRDCCAPSSGIPPSMGTTYRGAQLAQCQILSVGPTGQLITPSSGRGDGGAREQPARERYSSSIVSLRDVSDPSACLVVIVASVGSSLSLLARLLPKTTLTVFEQKKLCCSQTFQVNEVS
jgi:hypothetical protein